MPSEMDFVCMFSGRATLRFVSDVNVNITVWEKFKFFFKLILFRSIFQGQAPPPPKKGTWFHCFKIARARTIILPIVL